jgi:cold shock CspA family protein
VRRPCGQRVGITKWFSDRLGYGFITEVSGPHRGADLFTHYTSIHPLNNTRRTLQKGEYVSFDDGGGQAVFVTGVFGGPLMCDQADFISRSEFQPSAARNCPGGRARSPIQPPRRETRHFARARSVLTVSCPEGSTLISSTAAGAPKMEDDIPGSTTHTRPSCEAVIPPFSS